jgi:hypothetical protein
MEVWERNGLASRSVLRADACLDAHRRGQRLDQLLIIGADLQGVDLFLGERLGLLRSAEMALDEADSIAAFDGTGGYVTSDPRAIRVLRALAGNLIADAGLTLEAWLATRAPKGGA